VSATDIDLSGEVEETVTAQPAAPVDVNAARQKLITIKGELKQILVERDVPIDLVTNSIIAKQHGVFVGTGGVAKSMVIDSLMARIEAKLFKVMLRKSMPVEEIFGPLSLKGLENDAVRRLERASERAGACGLP
jgi:MoxR-like ATPase